MGNKFKYLIRLLVLALPIFLPAGDLDDEFRRRPPFALISGWDFNQVDLSGVGEVGVTLSDENGTPTIAGGSADYPGTGANHSAGDHDNFSFGSGEAFSIDAWIEMDDATNFRIISKADTSVTISGWEWAFYTNPSDYLGFTCYQNGVGTYIGRVSASTLTSREGNIFHVAATYDGSGSDTGISLYVDGLAISTSSASAGTFSAMSNTTSPVRLGRLYNTTANGRLWSVRLWRGEKTADDIFDYEAKGTE